MSRFMLTPIVLVLMSAGAFAQMTGFCFPNVGGTRSCPCGNPQQPGLSSKGCDSFLNSTTPSGVGGAILTATGTPTASTACTLVFQVTAAHNPPNNLNLHILWKGTTLLTPGVKNGFGVRCVGGTLKKAYGGFGTGSGGLGTNNAINFPNQTQTTDAWTASGMPAAGTTFHYYDASRDKQGPTNCFTVNDQFNTSNAGSITWSP